MTENMKRIHKVTIKRMMDESPDTSWLGEYSSKRTSEYSIDRAHSEDCPLNHDNNREAVEQLERVIAYLETVRQLGEPENVYWAATDESQDILTDLQRELEECDCGESGDMGRHEYRYFNPSANYNGDTPENIRKYTRQDYKRMESLNRGDWYFCGVMAEAEVSFGKVHGDSYLMQEVTSGGLWGIESDSGDYFQEVESEQLAELRQQLHAIGFSQRAISAAFKNVEHKEA